jgi:hypothetical protein
LAEQPPRVGDWALTIGNAFGLGDSVTAGIVSARQRTIDASSGQDFLQIDAPINKATPADRPLTPTAISSPHSAERRSGRR